MSVAVARAVADAVLYEGYLLTARVRLSFSPEGPLTRLTVAVSTEHPAPVADKQSAARRSLLGAHLLLEAHDCSFVSVMDPPPFAAAAAARCTQNRLAVTLADDPDADLHEWYGRYYYFAPDEIEPATGEGDRS
jgi:hypothetical protein